MKIKLTTGVIVRVFVADKYLDITILKRFSKPAFSISDSLIPNMSVKERAFLLINNVIIVRDVYDVMIL